MNDLFNSQIQQVTAFAPASIGNVAVGFDVLGQAIAGVGDTVIITRLSEAPASSPILVQKNSFGLPLDTRQNTATAGILRLLADLGAITQVQIGVEIQKGIPLSSGMGGSAASAVAGLLAFNAFLKKPLKPHELLPYILVGESVASGSKHGDNVVPSLFGGLQLIHSLEPLRVAEIPVPAAIHSVVVHPNLQIKTVTARAILKGEVKLADHVHALSDIAAFVDACHRKSLPRIAASLRDRVIEPQRAHLIQGFSEVKEAALSSGALGCSISGAGPSVFAWYSSRASAEAGRRKMVAAFQKQGLKAEAWVSRGKCPGARIVKTVRRKKGGPK